MGQQIFVLTDGAVMNIKDVVRIANDHRDMAEVHTFGIGSGASPGLVIELAEATGGTYNFAQESESINTKVISALSKAARPRLTNVKVIYYDSINVYSGLFRM